MSRRGSASNDGRESSQFRARMKKKAECQRRENGRFVPGYKEGSVCQGYGRSPKARGRSPSPKARSFPKSRPATFGAGRLSSEGEESLKEKAECQLRGQRGRFRAGYQKTAECNDYAKEHSSAAPLPKARRSPSPARSSILRPPPVSH
jgi:hypothetical protein